MRERKGALDDTKMTFCKSSLDVMDDDELTSMTSINGDDDENSNNSDHEVDHDYCILCAYCRLVGGDAHMIIYIKHAIFDESLY